MLTARCLSIVRSFTVVMVAAGGWGMPRGTAGADDSVSEGPGPVAESILPLLSRYCNDCHAGEEPEAGFAVDAYGDSLRIQTDYEQWEAVRRVLVEQQMPPEGERQPTDAERRQLVASIDAALATFDCQGAQRPGRVTLRRLNRNEYNNTIRDLIGLDLRLADDFPSDDVGHGFDNMGDVLTISPILMEKYVDAARRVAEAALADEAARDRILVERPEAAEAKVAAARRNLQRFMRRAYRRPPSDDEVDRVFELMRFAWEQDSSEMEIFQTAIAAVLSSPSFLFRFEADPTADDDDGIRALDSHELATRLSYFLWSSMPDEELFELADAGKLSDPDRLAAQARRMLADPKARALTKNFAGQWLQLRDVERFSPDPEAFPQFDESLRQAMLRETELFFETIISEDRSVLDFLTADFSFVNGRLARHYGLERVEGETFQRVRLDNGRRGVLTHASILMLTSNPTRTSPVKRGKWILDNVLGEPPPPPPPDVPELEEDAETFGSLRERMEQHRTNPSCAVCHTKMDALGLGLENFDVVGRWRDQDGRFPIDPSGALPGGSEFHDAAELMQILAEEKRSEFCRCLAGKLLTYALGRGLTPLDRCTVDELVDQLEAGGYRFGELVTAIVTSEPFRYREAENLQ